MQEPLVGDMKDFKTMKLPSSAAFWVGGGGGGEVEGRWRGGGGVVVDVPSLASERAP